jgi:hypothetical protein
MQGQTHGQCHRASQQTAAPAPSPRCLARLPGTAQPQGVTPRYQVLVGPFSRRTSALMPVRPSRSHRHKDSTMPATGTASNKTPTLISTQQAAPPVSNCVG